MGGTWMALAYGFGGMRDHDGVLTFRPRRPLDGEGIMRIPLTMRGQRIEVEIDAEARTVKYSLHEGEGLLLRHEDEEIRLTKGDSTATRTLAEDSGVFFRDFSFKAIALIIGSKPIANSCSQLRKFLSEVSPPRGWGKT